MAKKNKLIDAAEKEGILDEDFTSGLDSQDDEELDESLFGTEDGEYSSEDVVQQLKKGERESSSQRDEGHRSAHRDERGHLTAAQREWAAKQPKRANPLLFTPAGTLDAPPPRPGMVQRWVRFSLGSEDDPKNWLRKSREGWLPRPVESVERGYTPPTIQHGKLGNVIGVADLILCEMDERLYKNRQAYFRKKYQRQVDGIERRATEKVAREGHPIDVDFQTSNTMRRGQRKARAQDDT